MEMLFWIGMGMVGNGHMPMPPLTLS
ncbi:uncharacterized protein G2W53_020895 [Senna tora]|uniref:Uncharacterized protein n=1 Tax=Senna tora TaxID=362788 RepID=A0A834TKG7_9FABA|nr:uncharacterized protein G2W53_020895 [Senna tora]